MLRLLAFFVIAFYALDILTIRLRNRMLQDVDIAVTPPEGSRRPDITVNITPTTNTTIPEDSTEPADDSTEPADDSTIPEETPAADATNATDSTPVEPATRPTPGIPANESEPSRYINITLPTGLDKIVIPELPDTPTTVKVIIPEDRKSENITIVIPKDTELILPENLPENIKIVHAEDLPEVDSANAPAEDYIFNETDRNQPISGEEEPIIASASPLKSKYFNVKDKFAGVKRKLTLVLASS